jgi:hypothetical protein
VVVTRYNNDPKKDPERFNFQANNGDDRHQLVASATQAPPLPLEGTTSLLTSAAVGGAGGGDGGTGAKNAATAVRERAVLLWRPIVGKATLLVLG